jgi:hypothetical protein
VKLYAQDSKRYGVLFLVFVACEQGDSGEHLVENRPCYSPLRNDSLFFGDHGSGEDVSTGVLLHACLCALQKAAT